VIVVQPPAPPDGGGSNPDIGAPPADPPVGSIVYYHTDAIGSVRMTTDQNAQVVARYDYLPFGEQWNPSGSDPRMFAGKERDTSTGTGFDYFVGRYYSSSFGRFLSPDPGHAGSKLSKPQSWNAYLYV